MPIPTQQAISIDLIPGNEADATGPDGVVRITRTGDGVQVSVDGADPIPIGGGAAGNVWADARVAELRTLFPDLIGDLQFHYIKPTDVTPSTSGAAPAISTLDAAIIGGAMTPAAGEYLTVTGAISTDPLTQPLVWVAHGKFATPTTNYQSMGPIFNDTNYVNLVSYSTYDATHLCLQLFKTGAAGNGTLVVTDHVIDGEIHDYAVVFDGTTYTALVDGAVVGSTAVLTNLATHSVVWAAFNTTKGDTVVCDLLYGYELP